MISLMCSYPKFMEQVRIVLSFLDIISSQIALGFNVAKPWTQGCPQEETSFLKHYWVPILEWSFYLSFGPLRFFNFFVFMSPFLIYTWSNFLFQKFIFGLSLYLFTKFNKSIIKVHSHLMLSQCVKYKSRWHPMWHAMLNG